MGAAAALLAVFKIPFRPRVPSPLPCRLNVSPLFCLDKVPSLFRERVPSLFRLKVSPFRLKVPSLRGPMLSSFRRCMLLVREGSSILTGSDWLVVSNVGSFSTSTHSLVKAGWQTHTSHKHYLDPRQKPFGSISAFSPHFSLSPIINNIRLFKKLVVTA